MSEIQRDLIRSNDELRAAIRLAANEIHRLHGKGTRVDSPVLRTLRKVTRDARVVVTAAKEAITE